MMAGREAGPDRVVEEKLCERCGERPAVEGTPYCEPCTSELNEALAGEPAPETS